MSVFPQAASARIATLCALSLAASLGLGSRLHAAAPDTPAPMVKIADAALVELSGLAPGSDEGLFWGHNDYGNAARLFRLGADGAAHGRVMIAGAANRDWEDLAWRDSDDGRCLLIGEIGDNRAHYEASAVHFLPEPGPDAEQAEIAGSLRFAYPEGPRDAEGLAFDAREQAIYVLSKRATPPVLYRLPAGPDCAPATNEEALADPVAELILPPPPLSALFASPRRGLMFNLPTALAISRDGARMAVLSYGALYVFDRAEGEAWAGALQRMPGRAIFTPMRQAEALVLEAGGRAALVGSEGRPGRLQRVQLPPFDAQRATRPWLRELPAPLSDQKR